MNFKRIIPLFLAFLIVIQPSISYPGKHYDYSELTTIGVKLLYIIVTMAVGGYIMSWIQKRSLRPNTSFTHVNNVKSNYKGKIPKEISILIDQLENPLKYKEINALLINGILLYGPSGYGKTEFGRYIAEKVNCPFIVTDAPEFSQPLFGNSGASIRALFKSAEEAANNHPSKTAIIFIDEFDSIGSRKETNVPSNFSYSEIINTFLSEMDGFRKRNVKIIVIGATNYLNKIDKAILRSGRFDVKIKFSLPDYNTRKELIEHFLKQYLNDNTISSEILAQVTNGMTPADIKELFNATGRIAISNKKKTRDKASFVSAIFKIKKSERNQKIALPEERLELITKMMHANKVILPPNLSVEGLFKCTESMTLNEVNNIFIHASEYSRRQRYAKIPLDVFTAASLLVEDQIKRRNILEKIDIAQKIYQIDEKVIKTKWNKQELLTLKSSDIINTCENIASAHIS